jgi:hypothetical protein
LIVATSDASSFVIALRDFPSSANRRACSFRFRYALDRQASEQ